MAKKSFFYQIESLFSAKESSFIAWFSIFFLGTAVLLSAFGLLPSEFQEQSEGTSFVQSAENSVKQYIQGNQSGSNTGEAQGANSNENTYTGGLYSFLLGKNSTNSAKGAQGTNQSGVNGSGTYTQNQNPLPKGIIPDTLVIPAISVETIIKNPTSSNIDDLDFELTKGAVRYPGSGTIGNGNMFIFGHSTGYKIVLNKAYKVFNDLKLLGKGDQILLKSGLKTYAYEVTSVQKVNKNTTEIVFDQSSSMLTLSTCDSFGATTDRYVVEAVFKGER